MSTNSICFSRFFTRFLDYNLVFSKHACILTVTVLTAQFFWGITPALAQLDETYKVMVNNQLVNVGFGGEFQIRNIPAGTNLVRVYAICTEGCKTRYGRSPFFQVLDRSTFVVTELDMLFRDTPFPTLLM